MTQKELIIVKTVAEEKSISQAAKKLYIAQPSLSQSVKKIEESIGAPLFKRSPHGLILTCAGEHYYKTAIQILKLYNELEEEVSNINNLKTGRINMGVTNHLGTRLLPKILFELFQMAPGLEVNVIEDSSEELEKKLLKGMIDIVINHAPQDQKNSGIEYDVLMRDYFEIVLSEDHPLGKMAEKIDGYDFPVLDVKCLADEPFILLHKEQRIRQVSDVILFQAGITEPNIRLTVKNIGTAELLASYGLGVTFIPHQYISLYNSLDMEPAYYSIGREYQGHWDISIATLKDSFHSKAERLLIEIIKNKLKETVQMDNYFFNKEFRNHI